MRREMEPFQEAARVLLGLCRGPGRISAYPKPNRQPRVGLYVTRTYGMKLEEHSLAIAPKFWLVPALKSFTLSHHNGAFP